MEMKFRPWLVPNFCTQEMPPGRREEGFKEMPSWKLADVDADMLACMCDDFRAEVFRKAGKVDPSPDRRTP